MAVEPSASGVVEREIRIDAQPETVFDFFTNPELLLQWHGVEANLEPVPGGIYRVVTKRSTMLGRYVEVDRPTRVVFTWGFEATGGMVAPGASTVEVTLTADGDSTLLRLVHSDLPEPALAPHGRGWDHYLERLRVVAVGGDPGPDDWA